MSSLPTHGVMSAAIMWQLTHDVLITVFAFFLGIMNDALRVVFNEPDWSGTYELLHRPDRYFNKLDRNPRDAWYIYALWMIVPPIGLHAIVDFYLHKPTGGWHWWAWPIEGLFWIGMWYSGILHEWFYGIVNLF